MPTLTGPTGRGASRPHPAAGGAGDGRGAPTVVLLSPSGWGNLGDAAIVDSVVQALRARWPAARIVGVTLSPADTEARHGIEGFYLAGRSVSGYGLRPRSDRADPHLTTTQLPGVARLERLPIVGGAMRFANDALMTAIAEPRHTRLAARLVSQADLVLVAGGGQLDEFWGGAWGHPFALDKWARLARRAGTPLAFLSVGACELSSPLAQFFITRALGAARYVSLRDATSARQLTAFGAPAGETARVVPDLAYGLSLPAAPFSEAGQRRPLRVGVSPIAFKDPRAWPEPDGAFFQRYVATLAAFVRGLLAEGCEVSLFATDGADAAVIDDLLTLLAPAERSRVGHPEGDALVDLLQHLGALDLVVASRLHGVLLAQLCGRPTLALSYDRKVNTLMADMGMAECCLPITTATTASLLGTAEEMMLRLPAIQTRVRQQVQAYRDLVLAQYDAVFGPDGLLPGTR